ncbi:MAG TPA: DUF429 domain-containing protein [Stellaceae bacterium]|nr:DUF429 domain-containing protein [Stellaceae bacterium]
MARPRFVGIDGSRSGWIAVILDEAGRLHCRALAHIDEVASFEAERVLIDIPIGLPPRGRRDCDLEARTLLGAARSRVFLDARRPLLDFEDYHVANAWAKSDGHGISRQLWAILPKIAEVDRFITPARQDAIYEAHPELAFMRLNGGGVLPPKKKPEGHQRRRDLVLAAGIVEIDAWLSQRPSDVGADDVLDACALALAARDPIRLPCAVATDEKGLRMDIWY